MSGVSSERDQIRVSDLIHCLQPELKTSFLRCEPRREVSLGCWPGVQGSVARRCCVHGGGSVFGWHVGLVSWSTAEHRLIVEETLAWEICPSSAAACA
jgi:hypothetical protein